MLVEWNPHHGMAEKRICGRIVGNPLRNAALVGFEDINLLLDTEAPPAIFYLDLKCFDFHNII